MSSISAGEGRATARDHPLGRAIDDRVAHQIAYPGIVLQFVDGDIRRERAIDMARRGDHDGGQGAIQRPCRPWRDARRFDGAIEGAVELAELLEVHPVARLVQVQHREHEAGPGMVAADPAGRLDIFRGRLWLALYDHQPEASDIETNRDHVGCERDIDGFGIPAKDGLETLLRFRDLIRRDARGQLHRLLDDCDPRTGYRQDPPGGAGRRSGRRDHALRPRRCGARRPIRAAR